MVHIERLCVDAPFSAGRAGVDTLRLAGSALLPWRSAMLSEFTREQLTGWIADFTQGDSFGGQSEVVVAHADGVLLAWLEAACERRALEPDELELPDLRGALLEHVARLQLPDAVHAVLPQLARDLLIDFETRGRLANGRDLGLALATAGDAYQRARRGEVEQLSRPGAKLGRNDPCPCGSGKKFKRCCMGR